MKWAEHCLEVSSSSKNSLESSMCPIPSSKPTGENDNILLQ